MSEFAPLSSSWKPYDPKETLEENFKEVGQIAFIAVYDQNGQPILFEEEGKAPARALAPSLIAEEGIRAGRIVGVSNLSVTTYTGSKCRLIIRNGWAFEKCD